jgi:Tfp pilus assembly protein PilO
MEKLLKNLHWLIIAYAVFEFYTYYEEANEKFVSTESQIEAQRLTLTKSKKIKREIENYYKNIENEKIKIEKVAKEIEKMQQLLPSEISDIENISLLRNMADDVNIKEISIAPEKDDVRGFYIARRYKLKVRATFLQMLIMFEKIGENKRILNVGEAVFKKTEEPQRGKFQIISGEFILESYRFNPDYKEDRGIDAIENKFKESKEAPPPRKNKASKEEV